MTTLTLLDETDFEWVAEALDVVVAAAGQPWRVALELLDDTRRTEQSRAPTRFAAVVNAIQRLLGGRARNAAAARTARTLVLGKPTLTPAEREARIAYAAGELEVTCAAVETLLWSDLPRERPVELPRGRPDERDVAAHANLNLLQRALMRAQTVELRVWGSAGPLIHAAAARGLLTTFTRGDRGETVLDIVGPLTLFHRTGVYGRALASLAPLLADCDGFDLSLLSRSGDQLYPVDVSSPVLLPPVPAGMRLPDARLHRLLKELGRLARDVIVTPQPPIEIGPSVICPDIVLKRNGRKLYVELVGFWTSEFLRKKLELYRAAGIDNVVFCVDAERGCAKEAIPTDMPIVQYAPRMAETARNLAEHLPT